MRLEQRIVQCQRCPRLVSYRKKVSEKKVKRFQAFEYWGKPVPGFGDPEAKLLIIGLAPGAHGSNRTGRMFTGDQSGIFLYRTLYQTHFSNRAEANSRNDGLRLRKCFITALVRCVPPQNRPTTEELNSCFPYLQAEWRLLSQVKVIIALGQIAFQGTLKLLSAAGYAIPSPKPKFQHSATFSFNKNLTLIAAYHPSQQNTFTKRLTYPMFLSIFNKAHALL